MVIAVVDACRTGLKSGEVVGLNQVEAPPGCLITFSTAAGIHAGGKVPVILIQNTGLMEAGDSMRGWGLLLKTPVVVFVGYRGYTRHGVNTDNVADYTEPFLHAFGIKYYLVENDGDADRIPVAFAEAKRTQRPVAVLVGDEYHGFATKS